MACSELRKLAHHTRKLIHCSDWHCNSPGCNHHLTLPLSTCKQQREHSRAQRRPQHAQMSSAPRVASSTGFVSHESYLWHDSGLESYAPHVQPKPSGESPETKRRFLNLVHMSALDRLLVRLEPRMATDAEILRFHTPAYLQRVKDTSALVAGGMVGHELHIGPRGFDTGALSLGGVLAAVEAVMAGKLQRAYCLVRPPGHHAETDSGHGFCLFSNVSLAAAHAIAELGAKRVAIVDFDVHHGNGSEAHFYNRDDVLFISLHQDSLYPLDTGAVTDVGEGAGRGYNLNIPLPPGSGWGAYDAALSRVVLPALHAYKPDLLLVSCGFDASFLDPLGRMVCMGVGIYL